MAATYACGGTMAVGRILIAIRRAAGAITPALPCEMSSLKRTISGPVLYHRLTRDELMLDHRLLEARGRTARTLVKEGPLRLTLMALAADGTLPEHRTDGPVTIHVLNGSVVFTAAGATHELVAGEVLVFAADVPHAAHSSEGCVFLLTVVHTSTPSTSD